MEQISLTLDDAEHRALDDARRDLEGRGALAPDEVQVTTMPGGGRPNQAFIAETLLIVGGVLALAKLLHRWWREAQPGLIIDMRADAVRNVSRDSALPGNVVVTVAADGSAATVQVLDEGVDAVERILAKIIDAVATPAATVGERLVDLLLDALEGELADVEAGARGTSEPVQGGS
ncbi:hypothetical protein [Agrococcus sp. Marseille-P2731]|uniref:hypothetical protein n=1 Tax=Agrococcus sp. Marseille-P2731 TaxID=1841862 RepID=UPI00093053BA|nr:hypothetical protein [Agrococcus sp. Marseille-P2731]